MEPIGSTLSVIHLFLAIIELIMSSSDSMPSPAPQPKPARRWIGIASLLGLVLIGVGVGAWLYFRKPVGPGPDQAKPDLVAASHANARGIGHLDQLNFQKAIIEFEEAVKLAPDWTPAKINLGIALLNRDGTAKEKLNLALDVFKEVLKKEPDNPYAHYCSGIIHFQSGDTRAAAPHFEAVTRVAPEDAHAWYYHGFCIPDSEKSKEAKECYEKALKLNPYLYPARYALAQHQLIESDERREKLLEEFKLLKAAEVDESGKISYGEMGRYAEPIGKSPVPMPGLGIMPMFNPVKGLSVKLADGTTWATADKLDELRKAVRVRFGGTILLLDYNRDGIPDVLLLGAVTRAGKIGDLLLRNDGKNTFTDVTAEVGLDKHTGSLGGAVGDFDNDTFADLALAGPEGLRLFRNVSGATFADKTTAAGFDKEPGVFLSAAWVDLDQDGDLDLVAAKYAGTSELALRQLKGEKVEGNGWLCVFVNAGVSQPVPSGEGGVLSIAFQKATAPDALLIRGPVTGVIVSDVDADFDLDLVVLVDGQVPVTVLNDRLFRFHRGWSLTLAFGTWNGGLVLDANGDDQSDVVLIDPAVPPRFLVSKRDDTANDLASRLAPGSTDSPSLRSAAWVDLELDGRADVMGLSADRKPVFLQGDGTGKFAKKAVPFGPDADAIPNLLALVPVDLDGDGNPDVLAWSETGGLRVFRSLGNGNRSVGLALTGRRNRDPFARTNADGVGAWVRVHTGSLRAAAENTTLFAGLGQSRLPLMLGLGKAEAADAVRVRWPDGVPEAKLNLAGALQFREEGRKGTSCPILFAWNGERFAYVTDFLGAGSMGESNPDGSTRPPRPEESVKIESHQLAPKNGRFTLKVAEPMDEVMYLDKLRLDVIDHPPEMSVFPDERFATAGPQPTQERLFFRDSERIFVAKATDHKGRDVTATVRDRDGKHVDQFAVRSWLGYAEEHFVELDFNGRLKSLPVGRKVYLVLAGWVDYPYPESIYAATQAGVPMIPPQLEQKQADGKWKLLGEIGFPAGLTRVMTVDVTGMIDPNGGPVRIRTNLQIFWDQVFLAPVAERPENSIRELPVLAASLEHRGFVQEYSPNGKPPIAYDYDRLESVSVTRWKGKLTRTGDVTELLKDVDDRHVICGPGDEVTVSFDASSLPPLPAGWKRSFVLRSWGYCKDTAPTTITGGNVGPLPYRGMPSYPYDPAKSPPPIAVIEYDRVWNTRPAGRR